MDVSLCCILNLQIMEELGENGLRIYTFPTEDATVAEINNKMNVSATNGCRMKYNMNIYSPVYMLICMRYFDTS